jgi:hypothetical protein
VKKRARRTVDVIGNDTVGLEPGVEFVSHTVHHDGVESDSVEEVETQSEGLELVGEDRTSDFEDGEVSRGREDLEVSGNFSTGSERVEQSNDGFLSSIEIESSGEWGRFEIGCG